MTIIDSYILHLVMATPLLAALFITLIPAADTGSKLAMSKFFSLIGFLFILRLIFLFVNNQILAQHIISINLIQFNINFIISITTNNIFLFGAISLSLLADMFLYEFNDTKTNIHQVAPFLLTFILFISLGQKDIRVALPIISIANFIIYFIIGHSTKNHRGAAIFHAGIFILTCDALALVLLQLKPMASEPALASNLMQIAILLPGLSRITMPIFAPFMNTLFWNLDESEGPFILTFLHVAGFFILFISRGELTIDANILAATIGISAIVGVLYISLSIISEFKISILPYYFLAIYSSLSASMIFIIKQNQSWYISAIIFLTSIIVFMHASKTASLTEKYKYLRAQKSKVSATWFLSICLLIGIPGFGIGVITWPTLYIMYQNTMLMKEPWNNLWEGIIVLWIIALTLLGYGLLTKTNIEDDGNITAKEQVITVKNSFFLSPIIIIFLSLMIPIATIYVSHNLVK